MAHAAASLREMKWSLAGKAVTRRAFDLALRREAFVPSLTATALYNR
jgi:hypothetical protein